MSENGHGRSAQKRFNGDGNSGAAECEVWERWARAALVVKKVGGMPPEALGALDVHSAGWSGRVSTDAGQKLVFRELDQRFPDKVAADRMGEAMEMTFGLKITKNGTTEAFTGRSRLVFTRLQTEGANLPSEDRGTLSCVDADEGVLVEAESGSLMRYARQS